MGHDTVRGPHAHPAPGRVIPAPPPPTADHPESVTVTPGAEYAASPLRRWFAGDHWRTAWLLPIRVPVLDLARLGGGLTPVEHGGGQETVSLHMEGADGVEYDVRSVDKSPYVPKEYRHTIIEDEIRDQISAGFPTAAFLAAPFMEAAGILHVRPSLYVVPDDPRLGVFRQEFAGMLAEVETRPKAKDGEEAFEGASKVEKMDKFLEELHKSASNREDSRAYLTARLMDMYVGDWDRDGSQWRWARFGDKDARLWKPIPLDRDWAFVRSDGLIATAASTVRPELIVFDSHYPALLSFTFATWNQDRRLLQDLDRRVYDSTAHWLQGALSDSVIADAIAHLPPEQQARFGAEFTRWLKGRRERLPALAEDLFQHMSWGADVHSTADPSVVDVTRHADTLNLRVRTKDGDTYYDRSFVAGETHEVRLYLDGGPDSVTVRGGDDGVKLRIVSAGDGSVLVDSGTGHAGETIVYDYLHPVRLVGDADLGHDSRRWHAPRDSSRTVPRDVGQRCQSLPDLQGGSDVGAAIGLTIGCDEFGFRQYPYALRNSFGFGYGTAAGGGRLSYQFEYRPIGTEDTWFLSASAWSARFVRYFGVGDHTVYNDTSDFYRARESYFELKPGLTVPILGDGKLSIGPDLRYWQTGHLEGTVFDSAGSNGSRVYGLGPFGTISGLVVASFDTRDSPGLATRGLFINITGRGVPAVWNADQAYGSLRGSISTYLTSDAIPLTPTLALRVGGTKVWGDAPFQDLAHIGGATQEAFSVRGYLPGRFTGNAAAYGNAQLEIPLVRPKILIPTTVGVIALDDIGRVFAVGDNATTWHNGVGGGIFIEPLDTKLAGSLTLVHGSDGWQFYFGFGTGF